MNIPVAVFAAFLVAALIICVTPGPDMIYIISFGLAKGRTGGIAAATGVALGMLVNTVLAAFGVSALAAAYPAALTVLRFCGVGYLVYLGLRLVRNTSSLSVSDEKPDWSLPRVVAKATAVNVTNPKVLIFYISFLPQFTSTRYGPVYLQMLVLGLVFVMMGFATDATVGLLSGDLGGAIATSATAVRRLNLGCGCVMFALAVVVLLVT